MARGRAVAEEGTRGRAVAEEGTVSEYLQASSTVSAGTTKQETKPELLDQLERLVLKELVDRLKSGEATAGEIATATQMLAKAGALERTGRSGKGGDDWLDFAISLTDAEFEEFMVGIRLQRQEARERQAAGAGREQRR